MLRYLLVVLGLSLGAYFYVTNHLPCKQPITYNIGSFDTRFDINQDELKLSLREAEGIWEKSAGKDLFNLNPDGKLSINLIYDDRQATTEKNQDLESKVNATKEAAASVKNEYMILEQQYKNLNASYTTALSRFQKDQEAYNTKVEYWNSRGGAPSAEFEKLKREETRLAGVSADLESRRKTINELASQINAKINLYNKLVDTINSKIHTINQSAGKEFNEGEYVSDREGRRINIYEFTTRQELVRVLAHEFGHALGLEHNNNPDSIMYYLNESTNLALTPEDMASLKDMCGIK